MTSSLPKYALLTIGAVLLMIAGASVGTTGTAAAPLMALTDTAEPATRTPTSGPTDTPRPTNTPGPTATKEPSSKPALADPVITKESSVSDARIGDQITFTIRVTNNGPNTADDVVVTDPIPDYLDVIEATTTRGDVSSNGRTVIVAIGKVPAGDQVTIRIRVRVNERAEPASVGRNTVSLTTSSAGDNPSNNSSDVTFNIVGPATPTVPALTPSALALTPVATPVTPAALPITGAADDSGSRVSLLAALGLAALLLSLLFRGKSRE
ncbi:MAG: DUF11 domain-containing protein [Roseiflexaceae bacterium]